METFITNIGGLPLDALNRKGPFAFRTPLQNLLYRLLTLRLGGTLGVKFAKEFGHAANIDFVRWLHGSST